MDSANSPPFLSNRLETIGDENSSLVFSNITDIEWDVDGIGFTKGNNRYFIPFSSILFFSSEIKKEK